jgi:hypothetical protein
VIDGRAWVRCANCLLWVGKDASAVGRARREGAPLYCGRECAGMARRRDTTPEQRKAEKLEYDRQRRAKLGETLRAEKRAAYYRNHATNLAKAAERRRDPERIAYHNAYCRRPEYVAVKSEYDRRRRAGVYQEFADAFLLLQDLEREIDARADRYEVYMQNGTINKAQTRKRALS